MTDEIKKEVSSPENWTDALGAEPIDKRPETNDDIIITKTEVKEERYDYADRAVAEKVEDVGKTRRYACSFCEYSTDAKRVFLQHLCTHTKEKPFRCSVCEFATAYKYTLKTHVLVKHGDKAKKFNCEQCDYSTHRKVLLKEHTLRHVIEKKFKCDMCDFTTKRKIYLKTHWLLKHAEQAKQHKCETCGYTAISDYHLKKHLRIHSTEKQYKCTYETCDFATIHKISLKNHVLVKHSGTKKRYTCEYCDYSSHTKANLSTHVHQHADRKPFSCDACDFTTIFKGSLKSHVLMRHSDEERRHKCPYCDHSAHLKCQIDRHVRVHTKEKPFGCEYESCGYRGAGRAEMKLHVMHRHTFEKPFRCDKCEYSCTQSSKLTNHVKRKHAET